ncbi:unnamed protein product [Spirodela intermedia]|uniref:Uncharacterized protein n=1 Tax=Spirodela intermedia TaxID=51605 RepID=A0A7I8IY01_SPIIN|nr:unnamed protein product [Spirodela intermedia]CAA6662453.1 unnamed protein product [Spirodela intermedia]
MTSHSKGSSCSVHGLEGSPWTKTTDFAALRRLSPDGEELDGGGAHVRDFILRSAQQEEALHRIWYALRRGSATNASALR